MKRGEDMKKLFSILLAMEILASMATVVFATGNLAIGEDSFQTPGGGLANIGKNALGIVQWIGWGIAIGMLIYIGIKYMMASANEKADLKKGAINYVIGAILIASGTSVVVAIGNWISGSQQL